MACFGRCCPECACSGTPTGIPQGQALTKKFLNIMIADFTLSIFVALSSVWSYFVSYLLPSFVLMKLPCVISSIYWRHNPSNKRKSTVLAVTAIVSAIGAVFYIFMMQELWGQLPAHSRFIGGLSLIVNLSAVYLCIVLSIFGFTIRDTQTSPAQSSCCCATCEDLSDSSTRMRLMRRFMMFILLDCVLSLLSAFSAVPAHSSTMFFVTLLPSGLMKLPSIATGASFIVCWAIPSYAHFGPVLQSCGGDAILSARPHAAVQGPFCAPLVPCCPVGVAPFGCSLFPFLAAPPPARHRACAWSPPAHPPTPSPPSWPWPSPP